MIGSSLVWVWGHKHLFGFWVPQPYLFEFWVWVGEGTLRMVYLSLESKFHALLNEKCLELKF